ncbi:MAG: hypothetical protein Q8L85_03710 [Alphaproteobacteria bacterium]|nr:hypothetical protein [Alphaproteobacteria bacterium]
MNWQKAAYQTNEKTLMDLFDNKMSAIILENFINNEDCQKIQEGLQQIGLKHYNYQYNIDVPEAKHIFDTHYLYEHKKPEEYFPKAKETNLLYRAFCDTIKFDPFLKVQKHLSNNWIKSVQIAKQNNNDYTHVIARELQSSALLHADFAQFIPKHWSISEIIAQYAWNIYLTDPGIGGECVVYNKLWAKEDDQYIYKQTYGYDEKVVEGKESTQIAIKPGSLVFFNSRNFHKVNKSQKMRLSIGGHVGLTSAGNLLMWV